jgi:hypothetical protein
MKAPDEGRPDGSGATGQRRLSALSSRVVVPGAVAMWERTAAFIDHGQAC